MTKIIDFEKTVYELCSEDNLIIEIMKEIGFENITKQGMLQSVGRVMTIPKGARMRRIELRDIIQTFEKHGYTIKR